MSLEIIAMDLDGTLLISKKQITAFTEETLLHFAQNGKTLVLASGRYMREVKRYAEQLKLSENHGYMICGNGYEVIDCANGHVHHFDRIHVNLAKDLVHISQKHHVYQYIQIKGVYHLCTTNMIEKIIKFFHKTLNGMHRLGYQKLGYTTHLLDETIFTKDIIQDMQEDVVKIALSGMPDSLKKCKEEIEQKYPDLFAFYYVSAFSLEICMATVSKKNAVAYVCEQLGLSLDNVIAFGDSGNDEPLLKAARIGVTMKNGSRRALSHARTISDYSNEEDGVAKACLKYIK